LLSTSHVFVDSDAGTTEIYTLSLHDALPIYRLRAPAVPGDAALRPEHGAPAGRREGAVRRRRDLVLAVVRRQDHAVRGERRTTVDRKSTRLNSSHVKISYAVFCLKKKKHTSK